MDEVKILICGDSYMALDSGPDAKQMNVMHWSQHLGSDVSVINYACAGASNTMILMQLRRAIAFEKFDGVVLGFTSPFRLEFDEKSTSVHFWISKDQKLLDELYRQNIYFDAEFTRNIAIIENTILLAKKYAPTVFTLNQAADIFLLQPEPCLVNLKNEALPLMLHGHREFGPMPDDTNDRPWASFHLADPEIHKKFALQVREYLAKM